MADKLRILLIAEAANPQWTSVPLEGWSHSQALAEVADVHLVTQVRNRQAILDAGLLEGEQFTAIDSEAVARRAYKLASLLRGGKGKGWTMVTALSNLSYYYFEHLVWKSFSQRIKQGEFDVVHRLIPLSPTTPSLLAGKCRRAGVPFVVGPLNGGVPWPRQFNAARHKEREWLSYVRGLYRLLPGYRSMRRHAAAIIIGSQATWELMPRRYHHKCVYIPENAIDPARFTIERQRKVCKPIRVLFLGRLVPYKGPDMLLQAAKGLLKKGEITLDFVGDGPLMPELKEFVKQNEIESAVTFSGWIQHTDIQQKLAEVDVFAFPSIREFGGAVVLEAMAMGVVPIVVDYGGPGELVTPRSGYLVAMAQRKEIVRRFEEILTDLVANPHQLEEKSAMATQRLYTHFTWQAKASAVLQVYRWVLGQEAVKPNFTMPLADTEDMA